MRVYYMPVFEHKIRLQAKDKDGKSTLLPPSKGIQFLGPVLNVLVSPTRQHLESLERRGLTAPQPISGLALIDTGASSTAVDENVCRTLGLLPTGRISTAHAGGPEVRMCYPIQISFPRDPLPSLINPRAMSVNLQYGKTPYILLFGRDLLSKMKFVYHGLAGRFEIAF